MFNGLEAGLQLINYKKIILGNNVILTIGIYLWGYGFFFFLIFSDFDFLILKSSLFHLAEFTCSFNIMMYIEIF